MKKIEILHIDTSSELINFQQEIFQLFFQCFGFKFKSSLWEWAYLKNPLGNALVNLAFLNQELVGHYAFIPIKTTKYKVLLSITTMVAPHARKNNTFFDLAIQSYHYAQSKGFDIIIGFPNLKSAIIHEKILDWHIKQTYIAQCSADIINDYSQEIFSTEDQTCKLKIDNEFLKWRLSKPNTFYKKDQLNIYKYFQTREIDLLTIRSKLSLSPFRNNQINFLTQSPIFSQYKKFDYPFAYKNLQDNSNKKFHLELLMSDIF
ncbi:GNAT family N-acetyltransferase [Helicobacter pametensis]|uniref:GNAT family N-acetyltransferase n=1 Tax=Helicobacter pametensis TaxID=95149 RepID=UPI0004809950|nr:GNAT family N-acetyltransferase [Helicobacter pametensis]